MTDTQPPSDPNPEFAAQDPSIESSTPRAANVSGPAGWPGAVLSSATPPRPPEPAPVPEVEAIPLSRAEARGPSIRVEAQPRAESPRAESPRAESPRAETSRSDASRDVPPGANYGSTTPPPAQPTSADSAPVYGGKRTWAVLGHLAYLVPLPPHIAGLVITLLIWVWRRRRDAFVADQGRESLNFQLVYTGVNFVLCGSCILSWMAPFVWIVGAVLCIVAAVNAGDGKRYRYPLIFRLIE